VASVRTYFALAEIRTKGFANTSLRHNVSSVSTGTQHITVVYSEHTIKHEHENRYII
jgi:hypothetical protein